VDAIRLLKKDHREVEALFKEAEELGDSANASREKLFTRIAAALEEHTKAEEELFYPAVKAAAKRDKEAREEVLEAYEEHDNVKAMIAKLRATDRGDETYKAKLQVLHELVQHHVKEEEKQFFPEAKELLGEQELSAIGERIEAFKAESAQPAGGKRR
jgi:hemerythrin superfamily protein